ncbi:LytTR family DNA-binding domain-containing protein [Chishuiella sp.]|uniref:LytR/AlgR family response regulator transcription factor n=1 Tax=Chishuiella sp. TaxID=1969467 RepID=UPI0028AAEE40|nr:LytTR family DNA-binding domain-containing protein [Chishuiella sp.]
MNEKFSCIIIDDEPLGVELIEDFISQISFLDIKKTFNKPLEAMTFLQSNKIDIVFSDIEMPKLNGIDLFRSLLHKPYFIFITAHRDFAIDGFETGAVDYLIKPVRFERLLKAVNRVKENLDLKNKISEDPSNSDRIFIKSDGKFIKILLSEIIFIEAQGNYINIITKLNSHTTLSTMKAMEEMLNDKLFFRIQRAFIVNIDFIQSINGNMVELSNGKVISIALSKKEELFEILGLT